MKSKGWNRSKSIRYKTRSLQRDCKYIKTSRIRKDRRINKQILKITNNQDNLKQTIKTNNGNWELI